MYVIAGHLKTSFKDTTWLLVVVSFYNAISARLTHYVPVLSSYRNLTQQINWFLYEDNTGTYGLIRIIWFMTQQKSQFQYQGKLLSKNRERDGLNLQWISRRFMLRMRNHALIFLAFLIYLLRCQGFLACVLETTSYIDDDNDLQLVNLAW